MTFAIYKKDNGALFAVKYIDNIEDAPPNINASFIPAVINQYGGYCSFDNSLYGGKFVGFREADDFDGVLTFEERFPQTDGAPLRNGFISADGKFYSCEEDEHFELAEAICKTIFNEKPFNPEWFIETKGWTKVVCKK